MAFKGHAKLTGNNETKQSLDGMDYDRVGAEFWMRQAGLPYQRYGLWAHYDTFCSSCHMSQVVQHRDLHPRLFCQLVLLDDVGE